MIGKEDIARASEELAGKQAPDVLRWAAAEFGAARIALATSFGAEDQVLTHMICGLGAGIGVFTLDTGRLPQQTYDVMERTRMQYGIGIETLFPDRADVEAMVGRNGPNQFYESIALRKECCRVRKLVPLHRKLSTLSCWICGLRRSQAATRGSVGIIEWDEAHGLVKLNPLADWSEEQVWAYIKENGVPYNRLHDEGYPSIGCAPCTRAVKPGEDIRAGRWWWENPEHKECGLHSAKADRPVRPGGQHPGRSHLGRSDGQVRPGGQDRPVRPSRLATTVEGRHGLHEKRKNG